MFRLSFQLPDRAGRRMSTGLLLSALALASIAASADPAPTLQPLPQPVHLRACVFDPVGNNGPIANTSRDLMLEARKWGLIVTVRTYQDERVASEDFKAGQCEIVGLSTLRAKQYNRYVGSIDAPGNLRSYDEVRTLIRALANPAFAPMSIAGRYQVVGMLPIGSLFVMTRDRSINSIEKAAGKKIAVLDWDTSQAKMISAIGAQPVPSDITSFGGKFNNGQVDIIAAPAMAYEPLELYRGIGKKGGVIRFPLLHATGTILIRRDLVLPKIPDLDVRMAQVRDFGLQFVDNFITRLKAAEKTIPKEVWIELSPAEQVRYSRMVREARLRMIQDGVYDTNTMTLLKKVRCKHDPANEECSLFDE